MNLESADRLSLLWQDVGLVAPELWLIAGMCAAILVPFINRHSAVLPVLASLLSLALAAAAVWLGYAGMDQPTGGVLFGGMLTIDPFSQFFKMILLVFTAMVIGQWWLGSRRQTRVYDVPDFACLLLGACLGMALMASTSNLLMIFIATEAASLPSYALAGFRKERLDGSEGSLKYVIFGSASSAVALYGMSWVYGSCGTLDLAAIAAHGSAHMTPMLAVGLLAMFAGIAFKLSAVPLHFWCPDVFQAAPVEVTTFLSVASKGAAVCLLLRILYLFGVVDPLAVGDGGVSGASYLGLAAGVGILGGVTATWGNLVALHQSNLKRLLAYSSIAHAGYMIMTASVVVGFGSTTDTGHTALTAAGAILFYLMVYLFMNLGAFGIAGFVEQQTGGRDIKDLIGLFGRSPWVAVLLSLFLLSLFGMPGLGGFMAKVYLMKSMADAGGPGFVLISVLLLNTVVSLYFYMRPVYYMAFVADTEDRPRIAPHGAGMALLTVCAAVLLWVGLIPMPAAELARDHALFQVQPTRTDLSTDPYPPSVLDDDPERPVPQASSDPLTG